MHVAQQPWHTCASEPIRFSAAIQPHGYLISCELPAWTIRHVSANAGALFDVAAVSLIGQPLSAFVDDEVLHTILSVTAVGEPGFAPVRATVGNIGPDATLYDISVHAADGLLHLEFEARPSNYQGRAPTVVAQAMIAHAASDRASDGFDQRVAERMRLLTGHDRVLVYRFLPDGAGEVIAEACADDMEALLGLRFPEHDIPAQARALYLQSRIRVMCDSEYVPVPILPDRLAGERGIDLSQHILRSMSPMHRQYQRSIGVRGSMSVSILSDGRLWGLIVCHHRLPLPVSATVRAAAELFGLFVSMRVSALDHELASARGDLVRDVRESLWRNLSQGKPFERVIADAFEQLTRSLSCDHAALLLNGRCHAGSEAIVGYVASVSQSWLQLHGDDAATQVRATNSAMDWIAPGSAAHGMAGLLAIPLGDGDWLMFFRAEQVEHVLWASEPERADPASALPRQLRPRARLDAWRETIRGHSMAWSPADVRNADGLRSLLQEMRGRVAHA